MRESSFFCSMVSSAMRRLYLKSCDKIMLSSLHLSEWLEWKCKSAANAVGFLYRVAESLWPAPMWIFMPKKDISWVGCSRVNLIVCVLGEEGGGGEERVVYEILHVFYLN